MQNKVVLDYRRGKEKRIIQRKLFPQIKHNKLVTLAGPNMIDYLQLLPKRIKKVEIWENNRKIMLLQMNQLSQIKDRSISYRFGNIEQAELDNKAFYDLDFCCTIESAANSIYNFRDQDYSLTLCTRGCSPPVTINNFIKLIGEKIVADIPHPQYNLLKTNKSDYIYTTYYDTMSMLNIFKFH